jgi:preprotein translocase subunit YajC
LDTFLILLAQTSQPASQPSGPVPWYVPFFQNPLPMIMLIFLGGIMIFGMRSKKKQEQERKAMLSKIGKGSRVQTIGGILGTVVEVRDDEVLLKVDESSNTKMRFIRSAIHKILDSEKTTKP